MSSKSGISSAITKAENILRRLKILPFLLLILMLLIPVLTEAATGNPKGSQIPGWMTLLPPLVAIALALIFREVMLSLAFGILAGIVILFAYSGDSVWMAPLATADLIRDSLVDADRLSIILFSLFVGGLVHLISKNGGMFTHSFLKGVRVSDGVLG